MPFVDPATGKIQFNEDDCAIQQSDKECEPTCIIADYDFSFPACTNDIHNFSSDWTTTGVWREGSPSCSTPYNGLWSDGGGTMVNDVQPLDIDEGSKMFIIDVRTSSSSIKMWFDYVDDQNYHEVEYSQSAAPVVTIRKITAGTPTQLAQATTAVGAIYKVCIFKADPPGTILIYAAFSDSQGETSLVASSTAHGGTKTGLEFADQAGPMMRYQHSICPECEPPRNEVPTPCGACQQVFRIPSQFTFVTLAGFVDDNCTNGVCGTLNGSFVIPIVNPSNPAEPCRWEFGVPGPPSPPFGCEAALITVEFFATFAGSGFRITVQYRGDDPWCRRAIFEIIYDPFGLPLDCDALPDPANPDNVPFIQEEENPLTPGCNRECDGTSATATLAFV